VRRLRAPQGLHPLALSLGLVARGARQRASQRNGRHVGSKAPAIQNPAYRPAGVLFAPRPCWRARIAFGEGEDAAGGQGHCGGRLVGRAGRQRGARLRRALSPAFRDDQRRRPRLPARPARSGDAARRRWPQARGRPHRRSFGRARGARRNPSRRPARPDARRLASREPPPADRTPGEGFAHPP
jgi:hypothetical protein